MDIPAGFFRYDVGGLDDNNAAQAHARAQARTYAIRVAALAGNTWPDASAEYLMQVKNELLSELLSFAIHARRFLEIRNIRGVRIEGRLFDLAPEARDAEYAVELRPAINGIVHSRTMTVHSVQRPAERFTHLGDHRVLHVRVQSDRGEAFLVCPTALVHAFLGTGEA